jgi:5-methylthioadenosine/S-adenosylhomocysteine deaminase
VARSALAMSTSLALVRATLVTMDPARRIVEGDLLVEGGRIAGIGGPFPDADTTIDAAGTLVVPGFVQAHVHLCQALFKGLAEETDLLFWLREKIWPLEAAHDTESIVASARLGLAEAIRNGTTTLFDMGTVRHTDGVAEAAVESGIRVVVGKALMDQGAGVPANLRDDTRTALAGAEAIVRRWHGAEDGRIRANLAPRFVLSCSRPLWEGVAALAEAHDVSIHTHLNESPGEVAEIESAIGAATVAWFDELGILSPRFVGAHGVWFSDAERALLAARGARIAHCPSANFKLASGACDVRALADAGVVVGLGADGAPCNNRIDPFAEMRLAGLVSRWLRKDRALSAADVVALATIDGARALRWDDEIGSLEVGKSADFVVVEQSGAAEAPLAGTDPYTALVYHSSAAAVRTVVCRGQVVSHRGRVRAWDDDAIVADAERRRVEVVRRAGLDALLARAGA